MIIDAGTYRVHTQNAMEAMVDYVNTHYPNARRFIIADQNTLHHCLPVIDRYLGQMKVEQHVFVIEPGEESKTLDSAYQLWENFTDLKITRDDLILNIGGGVVTDLGGFVAATYKRGVDVVNVPTSLLAMADASVGGKVGVNFMQLKNQLGYFSVPKAVFIHPPFLDTLPNCEFISGYAEMLKHALIADTESWQKMAKQQSPTPEFVAGMLPKSIAIKNDFVRKDPMDKGVRQTLNFGHTIGHAIETLFMDSDTEVLHGEAVAAGMIAAAYISVKQAGMDSAHLDLIAEVMTTVFDLEFVLWLMPENLELPLKHDKKNRVNSLQFVLLTRPGNAVYNQRVSMEVALDAFRYVQDVVSQKS